ncbi:MAG: thioredoxin domain-containing protein [Candidatus Hydrogenedentes bacterium]|nr:thioredoxin domain-containing protein [Candidatus Hydrogenedentota bacterium]
MTPRSPVWTVGIVLICIAPAQPEDHPVKETPVTTANAAPKHTNRLAHETSPYLLQHAHNPVNWYPWGEEALEKARVEDKPIFLSIGYSACHWCHVMERESFEKEDVADILNAHFISIKVDREERPDIDEIYMTAVQILTGSGGWPMSVWLTPELKPFYGGTYYPPEDMYGRPGFKTVLNSIAQTWKERRDEVSKSADQLTDYVKQTTSAKAAEPGELSYALVEGAVNELRSTFDPHYGGFGGAPKFPSAPSIAVLLRHYYNTGDKQSLEMAAFTLTRMFNGGMYDHLGGGFHRYSVDAQWLVPHFEKMLYDNAQLVPVYLEAFQATGDPLFARVAREVLDYELRDMQDPGGAFHSTEDADSEDEEGKFYVWKQDEIMDALGDADGYLFCQFYNARPGGNFSSHEKYHAGKNILHITRPADVVAKEFSMSTGDFEKKIAECRAKLLTGRAKRVRPGLDDKVLSSWNGLMISALAQGYQVLGDSRYRDAAERAAKFLMNDMREDGVLLRTHRKGESRLPGYLDDYAFTSLGLIDLYEATFDAQWLDAADTLAKEMVEHFWDKEAGAFFSTTENHKHLLTRTKPTYDGAEPSGNTMAATALLRLAKLRDNKDYFDKAHTVLKLNVENMSGAPRGFMKMISAVDFIVNAPKEIAIIGPANGEDTRALLSALHAQFVPNKVVAFAESADGTNMPLLQGKTLVNGKAAAYVCKDYACQAPVTSPEEFVKLLVGALPLSR